MTIERPPDKLCRWTLDADSDKWDTECGDAYQFFEGGPVENKMRFCPFCGGRLKVKRQR